MGDWVYGLRDGLGCFEDVTNRTSYTGGWFKGMEDGFGLKKWQIVDFKRY